MTLQSSSLNVEIRCINNQRRLFVHGADDTALATFDGLRHDIAGRRMLEGELSTHNARALRSAFTHLIPVPVGSGVSAGVGDRLGLATAGHADAFRVYGQGVFPVFAQQSVRELDRLERQPQDVIDAATFGCVAAGWTGPVGADLDHIRTIEDIERGVQAGFTTYTFDPGDYVRNVGADLTRAEVDAVDWHSFGESEESLCSRYVGRTLDLDGTLVEPIADDVLRAAVKYADAVTFLEKMYQRLYELAEHATEVEIAVDETDQHTTLFQHFFIAEELSRRGLSWVGFAPRYVDGFEKGVEFDGDMDALIVDLCGHTAVARHHGSYKLSLHSGSDKFGIYDQVVEATEGRIHLKTSGTSYLTALEIIAVRDPELFREILRESVQAYEESRASYQVSAATEIDQSRLSDDDLLGVVSTRGTRQMLHVGYGVVLTRVDASGQRDLAAGVQQVVMRHGDEYRVALQKHLGRHLAPFSNKGSQ